MNTPMRTRAARRPAPRPRTARPTAGRTAGRTVAAAVAAVLGAAVLTACGADTGDGTGHGGGHGATVSASASATAEEHNAADVAFAQGMIPHHQQAIEMTGLVATRSSSQEVKDLAAKIKKAQDPEIATMSEWLTSWSEKMPAESGGMDHSGHGGHGDSAMTGMMSPEQMDELGQATGAAFDTAFLTMMIEHHKGAVEMAKTEKANGAYQPAKEMADAIISGQSEEIAQMQKMNKMFDQG